MPACCFFAVELASLLRWLARTRVTRFRSIDAGRVRLSALSCPSVHADGVGGIGSPPLVLQVDEAKADVKAEVSESNGSGHTIPRKDRDSSGKEKDRERDRGDEKSRGSDRDGSRRERSRDRDRRGRERSRDRGDDRRGDRYERDRDRDRGGRYDRDYGRRDR